MEYIYAALLLKSAKKEINEENLNAVLNATGIDVDAARIKSLVSSLEGIDIDEAIKKSMFSVPVSSGAPAAATAAAPKEEAAKVEEEEEEGVSEEDAAAGLGALFG